MTARLLLALCVTSWLCSLHAVIAVSPVYSLSYTTYGPKPVNQTAWQRVNATVYNGTLAPVNFSLPVLKMAGVVTALGSDTTNTALLKQMYPVRAHARTRKERVRWLLSATAHSLSCLSVCQFAIDMLNMHGGVVVNGTRYLVSLTTASDDSSPQLLQLLYSTWLNDPTYSFFLAPAADDQLKTLTPLMQATNRTFFNFLDGDPADFTAAYPYIFTLTSTKDQVPVPILTAINTRAQQYAAQVNAGSVPRPAGVVSIYGVSSVCIYTHNDTTQIEGCAGVRTWINNTNQQREEAGAALPSDFITIEQDVFWPTASASTNETLYAATIDQCPDGVDILIVCGTTTAADVAAVSQALAETQLRPKAAYTTNTLTGFDSTNAALVAQWSGWMTQGSSGAGKATIPSPIFTTKAQQNSAWQTYFNQATATSAQQTLFPSGFDVIRSAMSVSASLSSSDLRAAFLSLNGTTYVRAVLFSNVTGVNPASVTVPSQIQNGTITVLTSPSQINYPVAWPWSRIMDGDPVTATTSGEMTVLGFVLSVLGAWVAQIILEQAVFVRRRGGLYPLWLLLVAVSLGGSGMWCAMFVYSTTLGITVPTTGESLSIQWSLNHALLGWLPAVLLTWAGLMVMMFDVDVNTVDDGKQSKAQMAHSVRRQKQEDARKKAALSHVMHIQHLAGAMSRHVVIGGLMVLAGLVLTRVTLFHVWEMQANVTVTAAGEAVSIIVCLPLMLFALLCYYHALLLRVVAVFVMALTVLFQWIIASEMADYTYSSTLVASPSALYTVMLSSGVVSLICGIVAAVTCFAFIGLQFSRMQLSRNGLSILVAKLEALIAKQHKAILSANDETSAAKRQADGLARLLEAVNIVRPIATEWAFALASQSTVATLLSVHQAQQAAQPLSTIVSPHSTLRTVVAPSSSTNSNARKLEVRTGRTGSVPATTIVNRRSSQSDSSRSITAQSGHSSDVNDGEAVLHPSVDGASDVVTNLVSTAASPKSGGWTSESSEAVEADSVQQRGASLLNSSVDVVQPLSPSRRQDIKTVVLVSPLAAEPSMNLSTRSPQTSHASQMDAAEMSANSAERWKEYEQAVLAVLDQQADYTEQQRALDGLTNPGTATAFTSKAFDASAEDAAFPLALPAIGDLHAPVDIAMSKRASSTGEVKSRTSALASSAWPVPSLSQLLQHPVCVEIIKDELERTHSGENAMFYLHAIRYRTLTNKQLRRRIARSLVDTYIVEGAPQQINISTRQRDAILAAINKKSEDAITPSLFREAEREVSLLMDSNLKPFIGNSKHRLAVWCYHAIDVNAALENTVSHDRGSTVDNRLSSLLRDTMSKTHSADRSAKA